MRKLLDGIKVLDFTQALSGVYCAMFLGDFGADVIKVEQRSGDQSRTWGPFAENGESVYFATFNRNKRSISVDLRSPEGQKVILDLVKECDIVLENFKVGTLEKMNLSYDKMKKVNPQIIFGSISGFGQNGPLCKKPCYDVIATARSGVLDRTGGEDGVPIKPGFSLGDNWTGTNLFFGIGMALLNRQATGMGCRIDLAMLDSCLYMLEEPVLEYFANGDIAPRSGNFSATIAPYGMFQAKDGYITISCVSEEKWHDLCKALPLAHLLENPDYADNALRVKNRDALKAEIEHVTAEWDKLELEAMLQKQHIAAGAVMSMPDLLKDEQTNARELAPVVQHPRIGSFRTMGIPIKLSKTPGSVHTRPAPGIGEHTVEVLEDLGYAPEYIQSLLNSGAVAQ